MDVYFDYKEIGDEKLILGVVLKDEDSVLLQKVKEVDKGSETNFYNWTLRAFQWAVELAVNDGDDEVIFKNQQGLVFTWLEKQNFKDQYKADYKKIIQGLAELNRIGCEIGYEVVKGDKNDAKKFIKKQEKLGAVSRKGSLNAIFNDTPQNVVSFLSKARKQA